jgi:SAM-dependent methyltransferase
MTTGDQLLRQIEASDELPVREGYAAWAAYYDDDGNPLTALEGPAMREWFGPLEGRLALDLGCGTGRHTAALIAAGADVAALDFTPEMIERGRRTLLREPLQRRALWVRHALPQALPFRNGTFALVVMGLVAEHLDDVTLLASLTEVVRVLIPGGRCLLSAFHPDRTAEGQRARFIDPVTGLRRPIRTYHRTIADYHHTASYAGLTPAGETVLVVPPSLAESFPRACPYIGEKLGWVACWSRTP